MARPFMFAALCQRAHPLKHSLAESIFVSRVRKTAKKIFFSGKIRQQGHSLAEVSLYKKKSCYESFRCVQCSGKIKQNAHSNTALFQKEYHAYTVTCFYSRSLISWPLYRTIPSKHSRSSSSLCCNLLKLNSLFKILKL